jgi:alkanesulfonate monooxygenase SsuD/methylene tetrahydromethanopterin reductase-like flavin-dependent oxidoreductase (luciferase family)
MTHWFPLGFDALKHKTEVLARHCEDIRRDPATIQRTMASPVLLAASEREAAALVERLPPERRPFMSPGTPEQAAEALRPYIDAGFVGFTLNNPVLPTEESIQLAGELIRLVV